MFFFESMLRFKIIVENYPYLKMQDVFAHFFEIER
jgi:hypothetical protein